MILALVFQVLAVAFVAGAFYYRVWNEWLEHGLTHTDYRCLGLMAVGGALGVIAAFPAHVWWLALLYAVIYLPIGAAALTLIAWKYHAQIARHVTQRRPHGPGGHF